MTTVTPAPSPVTLNDYKPLFAEENTWCAGCGDFGILAALQQALVQLEIAPHRVMVVSGIGCGSKLPDYIRCNGWQTLHGRALPVAQGFRLVQHHMTVLAVTGDGDGLGEGGNHWIHAMRRNVNLTHLVENNQTYGLTKGQTSPTSDPGYISSTTPEGNVEFAINPISVALAAGATFVARGFSGSVKPLRDLIAMAIQHPGYAIVDILQPCVTWNRVEYTYKWFKQRVYDLAEEHDPADRTEAFRRSLEWGDRIPLGVFYREERDTLDAQTTAIQMEPERPVALRELPVSREQFEALKTKLT
ncbi:MAG: 2-oxoacid:ferredoxin oxidoreductase subunit beta [Chloroflexi bacterium]|nr:2-oxoacid:ferredoxin oxidoreductase subunit beta [Chloroflexota bacterium]